MGIIETNQPGVVRRMQRQAVPDAVRSLCRYGLARNFHLDPEACFILDFDIAIQAKQIFQTKRSQIVLDMLFSINYHYNEF